MVRLPSLVHVVRSAQETARRFPWTLLSALVSAGVCWLLIRQPHSSKPYEEILSRLVLPAMLGISLFFALALCFERSPLAERRHWVGLAIGLTVLLLFGLSYSTDSPTIYIYRFVQLAVVSHLLVAVAPFCRRGNVAAFWEFNRIHFPAHSAVGLVLDHPLRRSCDRFVGSAVASGRQGRLEGVLLPVSFGRLSIQYMVFPGGGSLRLAGIGE